MAKKKLIKKSKKNHVTIPMVHYHKVKNAGKNRVAKDFMHALKAANKIKELDECLSILVRAKDKNGKWYYSVGIVSLGNLDNGSQITLAGGAKGVQKLTVSKSK